MPLLKAFNEHLLWKGEIQKANYPEVKKWTLPIELPPLSYYGRQVPIDGTEYKKIQYKWCEPDGLVKSYNIYSAQYWKGVRERQKLYRLKESIKQRKFSELSHASYNSEGSVVGRSSTHQE